MKCIRKSVKHNSRFNALDTLVLTVHSVKMAVSFGRVALKRSGRPLSVMSSNRAPWASFPA